MPMPRQFPELFEEAYNSLRVKERDSVPNVFVGTHAARPSVGSKGGRLGSDGFTNYGILNRGRR